MTKTISDINLMEWFSNRKLNYLPSHFLRSSIPLRPEAVSWIEEKLTGRYAIRRELGYLHGVPYFEDQKELMLYELTFG